MNMPDVFNDPIISQRRSGRFDNPYRPITETLQVIHGYVVLTEVPNRFQKVKIVDSSNTAFYEIKDGELKDNLFKVDYTHGAVFFNVAHNSKSLTFTYLGEGALYFPDDRVYHETDDNDILTVRDKFKKVDTTILEQKSRVDEQIRSVPQPSEVVDMRIDHNGKIFTVAKDRIDAEQIKIEEAYRDKNGKEFISIKKRIDAEQGKIEEAYADKNNKKFFSLKERIDAEQKKIEDAYVDVRGFKYDALKTRLDAEYTEFYKRFKHKNAINYGADPTGLIPSADAIQRALDDIHNEGGGELYIPSGTYLINKRMYIYENTTVTMSESCTLLRGWAGGFFSNGIPTDNFSRYSGRGNIHITGGILDGNYANIDKYPTSAYIMTAFGHGENITIEGVTFKDVLTNHAIDMNGCKKVVIRNCKFIGFLDKSGERDFSEAIQLGEFTEFGLDLFGAHDATPNTDILIEKNYFGKSDLLGGFGCAVGNHYTVYDVYQTNIIIKNNTIEDCGFAGVRTYKWGEVQVLNNMFRRNKNCVYVSQAIGGFTSSTNADGVQMNLPQNGSNILIQGNNFYDFTNTGVVTYGQISQNQVAWSDGIRIIDNYFKLGFKEIGSYGEEQAISLVFAKNVFISNNRIYGGRRGIWIEGCFNTLVNNNIISQVDTEAVYLATSRDTSKVVTKSTHLSIENNEINSIGRNGIYIQSIDYFDIKSNNIFNTNQDQGGTTDRGGIYVFDGYDGRVEGNRIRGLDKSFAILVEAAASGVNVSNTNGTGRVIALGDNNFNGYYGTTSGDYINKIPTKGTSSDWKTITLKNGAQAFTPNAAPQYCIVGKVVHIRGAVKNVTSNNTTIAVLPAEARPSTMDHNFVQNGSLDSGNVPTFCRWFVSVDGSITFEYKNGAAPTSTSWFPIHTSFALE